MWTATNQNACTKKIQTPKDWLLAQLQSFKGLNPISRDLSKLNLELIDFHTLLQYINECLQIERLLFIQDEVQVLCRSEYGGYFESTIRGISWNLLQVHNKSEPALIAFFLLIFIL